MGPLRVVVCVLLAGPCALLAGEPPPALGLEDARALALARNWDLLAARAELDLAEAQRITARALPNPQLSGAYQRIDVRGRRGGITDSPARVDTIIAISQAVEVGGKRGARTRSADAGIVAARARFELSRTRLDAAVVKAYAASLAADENVRIARASADSLLRSAGIAAARFEAGDISEAERDQVAIAAGRFAAEAKTAEASARQARLQLQLLVGEPRPDGLLNLADSLDALAPRVGALAARADLAAASPATGENRADVRAAAAAVRGGEADLSLQRARRIPDPTLTAQYERDLPDNPQTVGFAVSLPIPLFDRNRGGIRAAQVARDSAQRELARTRAQARAEIAAARAALQAALERRRLVHDELLAKAERVQRTVAFAYEKGAASLLELLEAERNLNDLRQSATATQAEALQAAADLAAALGETIE